MDQSGKLGRDWLAKCSVSIVGTIALATLLSVPGAARAFEIRDLGTLGGDFSEALAVNVDGRVVGWSTTRNGERHAFVHDGISMSDLGTLGGGSSAALAINAGGHVVGWSTTETGAVHAFHHDGFTMRDLGTLGGADSTAVAINLLGQVVGWSLTAEGAVRCFLHDGNSMRDLGTLGGDSCEPLDVNDSGQVVGRSASTTGWSHAFLFDGAVMRDLASPGQAEESCATAINDGGQVAGWFYLEPPVGSITIQKRAFLYDGGVRRDIGALMGVTSMASDINNNGQVVGKVTFESHDMHAFLFDGDTMHDLGTPGGVGSMAVAINARGQVLGMGDPPEPHEWNWFLWDKGRFTNLKKVLFAAGWRDVDRWGQHLNDAGLIAGTGRTAAGMTHAFLMTPIDRLDIAIDIKPGSGQDLVNPKSRGLIKIALLSRPGFDPPAAVDPASLTFGRTGDEASWVSCNKATPDTNCDGLPDLHCHFSTSIAAFQPGDGVGVLRGNLRSGLRIHGTGLLRTVPR